MYINSNLCKNMYLEQESQDTNLFSNIISIIPAVVFYSMFGYYIAKFINYIQNKDENKDDTEDDNQDEINNISEKYNKLNKNYKYQFPDNKLKLLNDMCLDTDTKDTSKNENETEIKKKQDILDNMLSRKTLERSLIIYYIFVKKGNYKVITKNKETNELSFEEYNSNLEFKKYDSRFLQDLENLVNKDDDGKPNKTNEYIRDFSDVNELFNLDTSLDSNTSFFIGKKEYVINEGHLNMISWLYYSGLYEYLTTNTQLKYKILKDMYNDNLLTGNLFLRYHLFLQDNKSLIEEIEKNEEFDDSSENDESNVSDDETIKKTKIHKKFTIINLDNLYNLDDTDLENVKYSDKDVFNDSDDSEESDSILDNDLDELNLENELEEVILDKDSACESECEYTCDSNDEEYKKFMNYFENTSGEKYFEKYCKEVKNSLKL